MKKDVSLYRGTTDGIEADLIDSDFNIVLTGTIAELNMEKGYISVRVEDTIKYYDLKLKEKEAKEIFPNNTLFLKKQDGKYGYVDKAGNVIVPFNYDDAVNQNEYGYAAVKQGDKWGSLNQEGQISCDPIYNLDNCLKIDFIDKWHLGEDLNMNYYTDK